MNYDIVVEKEIDFFFGNKKIFLIHYYKQTQTQGHTINTVIN